MTEQKRSFALLGAAGYIAPRHMQAIKEVGGDLRAVCDPHDSVGVIDRFFPKARYFREVERFDRFLEKQPEGGQVDHVSICTPNYLHDAHVRLALRSGATAICEKPLVLSPWNLDQLARVEERTGQRVYTIMQLRLAPQLQALRQKVQGAVCHVQLRYCTPRGAWYGDSWKGDERMSGGLVTNLGIHMLDLLLWCFGRVQGARVEVSTSTTMAGAFELERATVEWELSTEKSLQRDMEVWWLSGKPDSERIDLSQGFEGLHTRSYEKILAGEGFGIEDARPAVELAHRLRK